jgi:hypothetical protein
MLRKEITIECDACGYQYPTKYQSAVEGKRELRATGWRFRNARHTCITCSISRGTMAEHTPSEIEEEVEI